MTDFDRYMWRTFMRFSSTIGRARAAVARAERLAQELQRKQQQQPNREKPK